MLWRRSGACPEMRSSAPTIWQIIRDASFIGSEERNARQARYRRGRARTRNRKRRRSARGQGTPPTGFLPLAAPIACGFAFASSLSSLDLDHARCRSADASRRFVHCRSATTTRRAGGAAGGRPVMAALRCRPTNRLNWTPSSKRRCKPPSSGRRPWRGSSLARRACD